jgi:tetratricopeptide (TPR) repeat protein
MTIEAYKMALNIHPESAAYYDAIGLAYHASALYSDALKSFKKAISINPKYLPPYLHLGNTYQQAIRIDPAYTEAYFQLGVTYLHSGDLESAKEEYNTLQNLDQELADKLYELINQ